MSRAVHALFASLILTATSWAATAPVFPYTPEQLREAYNTAIRSNETKEDQKNASIIMRCGKIKNSKTDCIYNDEGFQNSVSALKKMDVMNGRFEQKLKLTIYISGGKASRLVINGSRKDIVNALYFMSAVMSLIEVFEPNLSDEKSKSIRDDMGLMRGDDAGDIGKERVLLKPYAAITCIAVPSALSTEETCRFEPRS